MQFIQRRTSRIAIVTNSPNEVFQRDVIAGAQEIAAQRHFETIVVTAPQGIDDREKLELDISTLAGILVITNVIRDDVLLQLHEAGTPMSLVSHVVPNSRIPSVVPDNTAGIEQLTRHLVNDCQRHRLVFIQGDMQQSDGINRDHAFRQELMRHDLPVSEAIFIQGDFIPSQAADGLEQTIHAGTPFDAIVAADYLMAVAALKVLRHHGLRVPEDICVVGFGDGPEAANAGVTTVAADVIELGRRACRQLIGQIEGLSIQGVTRLSTELVPRQSTVTLSS